MKMVEAPVGGWFSWITTGSLPETQSFPPNITAAMDSQAQIGWGQLLHGRAAKEWGNLRPDGTSHLVSGTETVRLSSLWVLDTLDALWKVWFELWEERNGFVHGKTKQEHNRKRRTTVEQNIKEIYSRQSEYLPSDRLLLTGTAESLIERKSLPALTNWLMVWQPVFERSAARCRALAVRGVPPITKFFKPPASV